MREWQVDVESVQLADDLTDTVLERFSEAALELGRGMGPACGIVDGRLDLIVTVDADSPDEAARLATAVFHGALGRALDIVAAGMVESVRIQREAVPA